MSNPIKQIRGQIRQIVADILPGILSEELKSKLFAALAEDMNLRLTKIEANVRETLEAVDKRSKDSLSYLVRQATTPQFETPTAPIDAPAVKDEE